MSVQFVEGNNRTFTANNNPMDKDLRVVLNSLGYLELAGAEDIELGTLTQKSTGTLAEEVSVRLSNSAGTSLFVASGAIAANDYVYGAAGGKVSATDNGNLIGRALNATTADGDKVEVFRVLPKEDPIDGGIIIDDDFIGDWPAAATALDGHGAYNWSKTETNGLGVITQDQANGVLKFSFDAVAEAATATLFMERSPLSPLGGVCEFLLGVFDIGDNAALDIDFGVASDDHATDFEAISQFAAFHLDGNDLSLKVHCDDGTTDTAAVDTTVDLVDNTYYAFKVDYTDPASVKFYYRAVGAPAWTRLASGTTFDCSAFTSNLTPIVMVEKTSDDTTADVRLDRIRAKSGRL